MASRHARLTSLIIAMALAGARLTALGAERIEPLHTPSPPDRPAPDSPAPGDSAATHSNNDNRFRLQLGAVSLVGSAIPDLLPMVNLDYRWSLGLPRDGTALRAGFTAEIGVNYILPYAKAGIEIRLSRFFVDVHAGGGVAFAVGGHNAGIAAFPFYGGGAGYFFKLGDIRMELETGMNLIDVESGLAIAYGTMAFTW